MQNMEVWPSGGAQVQLKLSLPPNFPSKPPANFQSLRNKLEELRAKLLFQNACCILCGTETWFTPKPVVPAVQSLHLLYGLQRIQKARFCDSERQWVFFLAIALWCIDVIFLA